MARNRTKAYGEAAIREIIGINRITRRVESVTFHRNGVLSKLGPNLSVVKHPIKPGWSAEDEARLVFGLIESFSVPIELANSDHTKRRIEELQRLAAALPTESGPTQSGPVHSPGTRSPT